VTGGAAAPRDPLVEYLLRLGDDRLVLGHRLSEWCGHAPIVEEDIATANLALDLLGHATMLLRLAGKLEGEGRDEDALAYLRDERDFKNLLLCELPRGDFAFTIVRQLLFDAWSLHLLGALSGSAHEELAAIAAKALKETRYHLRHSSEWMLRLGDGTEESHARAQAALDQLWPWTAELAYQDEVDDELRRRGIAPDLGPLRAPWEALVRDVIARATLRIPEGSMRMGGGRVGRHTEYLGHMLAEMQIVARSHPGASW
jgi:ring-1,2-phenylacetyl-CoA epoxidase subunit PaaC